jgi:integrase
MPTFFHDGKKFKYYTQAQLSSIFKKITSPRDRALFNLMYRYGLRCSEPGLLRKDEVDFLNNKIVIRRKKGSVSREYLLFADTKRLLKTYLKERGTDLYPSLFLSRNSKPISTRRIDALWASYVEQARIFPNEKKIPRKDRKGIYNSHALKHSIAVHLRDAGKNLDDIQYLLGHKSRNSTEIYAQVSSQKEKEIYQSIEQSPQIVRM